MYKSSLLILTALLSVPTMAFAGSGDSSFGFWTLINILGALAFFIFGMKMMSEGIQRAAGSQMRNILRSMTKNRFLGVFTGFLITALVPVSYTHLTLPTILLV